MDEVDVRRDMLERLTRGTSPKNALYWLRVLEEGYRREGRDARNWRTRGIRDARRIVELIVNWPKEKTPCKTSRSAN